MTSRKIFTKGIPSYMQHTESSSKKTRDKIENPCQPRRMSTPRSISCFGELSFETTEFDRPPSRRRSSTPSFCSDKLPRYMQPTESSASKMKAEKYFLPPRTGSRNGGSTPQPKPQPRRIQMSEMAMNSFVESLRCGYYSDRDEDSGSRNGSRRRNVAKNESKKGKGKRIKEGKKVPSYQQPTVLSTLRTTGRTRS